MIVAHYEAVLTYATVINDMAENGMDYSRGDLVVSSMVNASFSSPVGTPIWIGKDRQRDKDYRMRVYNLQLDEFEVILHTSAVPESYLTGSNYLQTFLHFIPHASINDTYRYVRQLRWPSRDGNLPPDEPRCGFRDDLCKNENLSGSALAAAVAVPLLILVAFFAGGTFLFLRFW